jgi:hypothetical protein
MMRQQDRTLVRWKGSMARCSCRVGMMIYHPLSRSRGNEASADCCLVAPREGHVDTCYTRINKIDFTPRTRRHFLPMHFLTYPVRIRCKWKGSKPRRRRLVQASSSLTARRRTRVYSTRMPGLRQQHGHCARHRAALQHPLVKVTRKIRSKSSGCNRPRCQNWCCQPLITSETDGALGYTLSLVVWSHPWQPRNEITPIYYTVRYT